MLLFDGSEAAATRRHTTGWAVRPHPRPPQRPGEAGGQHRRRRCGVGRQAALDNRATVRRRRVAVARQRGVGDEPVLEAPGDQSPAPKLAALGCWDARSWFLFRAVSPARYSSSQTPARVGRCHHHRRDRDAQRGQGRHARPPSLLGRALGSHRCPGPVAPSPAMPLHELTAVTRNTKDFRSWDVPLSNPWEPEQPQRNGVAACETSMLRRLPRRRRRAR